MVLGFSAYIWFAWLESRDQLNGRMKSVCAAMSRWRIFRACCSGEIGIRIRASELNFPKNPLNQIALEMKEIDSVKDKDAIFAEQKDTIKKQADTNKKQADTNKKQADTIKRLQDANRQLKKQADTIKNLQEEIANWKEKVRKLQGRQGP